ncbi:hypothetical protein D9M68_700150 [compost metagenome]
MHVEIVVPLELFPCSCDRLSNHLLQPSALASARLSTHEYVRVDDARRVPIDGHVLGLVLSLVVVVAEENSHDIDAEGCAGSRGSLAARRVPGKFDVNEIARADSHQHE